MPSTATTDYISTIALVSIVVTIEILATAEDTSFEFDRFKFNVVVCVRAPKHAWIPSLPSSYLYI